MTSTGTVLKVEEGSAGSAGTFARTRVVDFGEYIRGFTMVLVSVGGTIAMVIVWAYKAIRDTGDGIKAIRIMVGMLHKVVHGDKKLFDRGHAHIILSLLKFDYKPMAIVMLDRTAEREGVG